MYQPRFIQWVYSPLFAVLALGSSKLVGRVTQNPCDGPGRLPSQLRSDTLRHSVSLPDPLLPFSPCSSAPHQTLQGKRSFSTAGMLH